MLSALLVHLRYVSISYPAHLDPRRPIIVATFLFNQVSKACFASIPHISWSHVIALIATSLQWALSARFGFVSSTQNRAELPSSTLKGFNCVSLSHRASNTIH